MTFNNGDKRRNVFQRMSFPLKVRYHLLKVAGFLRRLVWATGDTEHGVVTSGCELFSPFVFKFLVSRFLELTTGRLATEPRTILFEVICAYLTD